MDFQAPTIKSSKFNLLLIYLIALIFISCTNEDNQVYVENKITFDHIKMELEILDLVNDHRNSIGLNTLKKLNIISEVAKSHSKYMANTGIVDHENFSTRSKTLMINANAKSIGENLGFGYGTAKGALNAWLNSDTHKKVIENSKYTHFGISIIQNDKGNNYFTNIFILQ